MRIATAANSRCGCNAIWKGGFDVWLDRQRLTGGDRWTNEIEGALDRAEVVLALLSDGSFASDTCRAEQGWALDAGKGASKSPYCART